MTPFPRLTASHPGSRRPPAPPRRKGRRPRSARPSLERLEDRTVPSAGTIQGSLFEDLNGKGARDAGEPGLAPAGVTVYLDQNHDGVLDAGDPSATTDASGAYSFSGLAAGTYAVAQVGPAGMAQTGPAPTPDPGALGDVLRDIPSPTSIPVGIAYVGGSLYVGSDSSTVYQIDPATGTLLSTITVSGSHQILGLTSDGTDFWAAGLGEVLRFDAAGNVLQSFAAPAGHALGAAWDGKFLWVADNGSVYDLNVGNPQVVEATDGTVVSSFAGPEGEVSGLAFDGQQLWAADWTGAQRLYELDRATGAVLRSVAAPRAVESTNGVSLDGLGYDGQALWVSRHEFGQPGNFPAALLRVDTSGPGSQTVVLETDETVSGIDFGNFQLGSVSGRVYRDDNNNGVQDGGEPGLEGWRVYLDGNGNGAFDLWERSALTDARGDYSFTGLRAGNYNVAVDLRRPGWAPPAPATGSQTAAIASSGQTVSGVNFGDRQVGVAPVGPEFPVNATTTGPQGFYNSVSGEGQARAVATDSQGNFVVVWEGNGPGDGEGVFARLYGADGTPRTGEFRVNLGATNPQRGPVVAMNATGTFAVAWWTADPSLGTNSVVARVFNPSGTARSGDLAVTAATNKQTFVPTGIGMDDSGNFVVLYHGGKKSGFAWNLGQILFQRYNSLGQTLGSATQAASAGLINGSSSVAMAGDGRFAVAWNDGSSVYVQRYSPSAKKTGALITAAVGGGDPSIAVNATGSFVVGANGNWNPPALPQAQIFNADGTPRSGGFSITALSGPPAGGIFTQSTALSGRPSVSMDGSGNVVFAWSDTANVKARRFSSTGVALEEPFVVSGEPFVYRDLGPSQTQVASVSMTGSGNFVVAWNGPGAGDPDGVFAQRFVAPGGPGAGPAALLAAGVPVTTSPSPDILTDSALRPIVREAVSRWQAAGADREQLRGLGNVQVRIADLGGAYLGLAYEASRTLVLDGAASGWGWFVDPTPRDDSEFTTPGNQGEQNHMDLLTVLMHEMGHLLGLDRDAAGVMQDTLPTGTRRLPTAEEVGAVTPLPPVGGSPSDDRGAAPAHPPAGGLLDRLFAGEGAGGLTPWDADLALLLAGRHEHRG
jgi:hypothetical protein